jgi:Zn-dependent protease
MKRPHLTLFGFPIRIEPIFFLLVGFIAFQGQDDLFFTTAWILIVTASVLIHELGHAFAYRHYGASPAIALYGLGGLTIGHNSGHLSPQQRIIVAAAGSITTMAVLGGPAWLALQGLELAGDNRTIVNAVFFVNVVWAAINLAPVFPLDGGHIIDDGLLLLTGQSQRRLVNWISLLGALAIGGYFFVEWGSVFVLIIFGYMAWINVAQLGQRTNGRPRPRAPSLEDVLAPRPEVPNQPRAQPDGWDNRPPPTAPPVRPARPPSNPSGDLPDR